MLISLVITTGCSGEDVTQNDNTREFVEGTLSEPEPPETTSGTPAFGGTTFGTTAEPQPDALLRLEGDPKVTFSGICNVGADVFSINGRVPERYRFKVPTGQNLSCRIQKRDPSNGNLRVVLLAGENTRSVQQTNSRASIINLSYSDN